MVCPGSARRALDNSADQSECHDKNESQLERRMRNTKTPAFVRNYLASSNKASSTNFLSWDRKVSDGKHKIIAIYIFKHMS